MAPNPYGLYTHRLAATKLAQMDTKYKISYLFGAGASAYALPTVRRTDKTTEYANSLRELAEKLKSNDSINSSYIPLRDDLYKNLYWLAQKGDDYGTIDTYAKYCYDKQSQDLSKIKETLSLYFTIKQHIEKQIDPRYKNFLIKVIEHDIFPDNIKILNWNYDFQMQLAGELYRKEEFHYSNSVTHRIPPLITYYPALGNELNTNDSSSSKELSMVHLNGIAGFYFYEQTYHILNYHLNQSLENINQLFERFQADKQFKHPLLTFAYEDFNGANFQIRNRLKFAADIINKTDILVIIGYSFPQDNIKVDKYILDELVKSGLKKIIFQNPQDNGKFLIDEFGLCNIEIVHKDNCNEFYIPRELKLKK